MIKNKIIGVALALVFVLPISGLAIAQTNDELLEQIQDLLQQVKILQDKLAELEAESSDVRSELREVLQLTRSLSEGMTGEDVEALQEILATDPEIYPEGFVTGYFGPLTEKAVKNFQKKFGIEQVGVVGPKTLSKLNSILAEGAGNSGKVPPGLLIAPGIAKKFGDSVNLKPLDGQVLPPGIAKKISDDDSDDEDDDKDDDSDDEKDETAPVISEVETEDVTSGSGKIKWDTNEDTIGMVYYSLSDDVDVNATSTGKVSSNKLDQVHEVTLSVLSPDTLYYFFIEAKDEAENIATSTVQNFTTLEEVEE